MATIQRTVPRILAALALAVDAVVHGRLAGQYDAVTAAGAVSEGALFRAEAVAAALAALLVLLWRHRLGDVLAWGVALAGLAAVLLYRYVDVGAFGPLPDMYEPIWSADKITAAWSQAVAALALTVLLVRPAPNGGGWRRTG